MHVVHKDVKNIYAFHASQLPISQEVKKIKWGWISHTQRNPLIASQDRRWNGIPKERGEWDGQRGLGEERLKMRRRPLQTTVTVNVLTVVVSKEEEKDGYGFS